MTASDGKAALVTFQREKPDFRILNLNLPNRDALDICKAVRRDSNIPILMLTASVVREHPGRWYRCLINILDPVNILAQEVQFYGILKRKNHPKLPLTPVLNAYLVTKRLRKDILLIP